MTLIFYVNNQTLSLSPTQQNVQIVADSKNYLVAKFIFQTQDWDAADLKFALFSFKGKTYKKFLGVEEGLKDNECYVAPEVLKEGTFSVSVFGGNLISTNKVNLPVISSGYTENIVNQTTSPTVREQTDALMYKYASFCNEILKECQKIYQDIQKEVGDK